MFCHLFEAALSCPDITNSSLFLLITFLYDCVVEMKLMPAEIMHIVM